MRKLRFFEDKLAEIEQKLEYVILCFRTASIEFYIAAKSRNQKMYTYT